MCIGGAKTDGMYTVKIHLFLGEYNECAYLYKEAEETETDSIHAYVMICFFFVMDIHNAHPR